MFISTILINKWTQIQIPNYIYHPRKIAAKQDAYYMTIRQPPLHDFVRHKKKHELLHEYHMPVEFI